MQLKYRPTSSSERARGTRRHSGVPQRRKEGGKEVAAELDCCCLCVAMCCLLEKFFSSEESLRTEDLQPETPMAKGSAFLRGGGEGGEDKSTAEWKPLAFAKWHSEGPS
ncbi:hypothetical protein ZHAS_00008179 [Anopheles sinensis]|uniref:Uncharacterized protein n=1 Tax=Anopheles sinensis TaxID=74873 RepID=A0A084VS07_ANOSI|nr:hypothetical protein ZHAS_00008179 [Anopheles sinensis]